MKAGADATMTSVTTSGHDGHLTPLPDASALPVTTRVRGDSRSFISRFSSLLGWSLRSWFYGTSLYARSLRGRHPLQLLASPDDPAPGDATAGKQMLAGEIDLPDGTVSFDEGFWSRLPLRSNGDQSYAHRFHWLQDLAQVSDQAAAVKLSEAMVESWMPKGERYHPISWDPETLARRQINWIAHAPLILSKSDQIYKSRLLTIMAQQARHLVRVVDDVPLGLPRIYTAAALALSGLLLPGGKALQVRGFKALTDALDEFVLADGGVRSRNPSDAVRVMQQLVLVRDAALAVNEDGPDSLQTALDRLAPFVRAMRHASGAYAQMNGASADYGHGTEAVLLASEASGGAVANMPHTGYQRVQSGEALLIIDSGPPPQPELSDKAHASTGCFEFSHGRDRIFLSIGHHENDSPLGDLCRTTAAHNAMVVGDRNSTALKPNGRLGKGVSAVRMSRGPVEGGTCVNVGHDGYQKRFNASLSRSLWLSDDGGTLVGLDEVKAADPRKFGSPSAVIRFHLAPECFAEPAADGTVSLTLEHGAVWSFAAESAAIEIADSLYLPTTKHQQPIQQLVLTLDEGCACHWQLTCLKS